MEEEVLEANKLVKIFIFTYSRGNACYSEMLIFILPARFLKMGYLLLRRYVNGLPWCIVGV